MHDHVSLEAARVHGPDPGADMSFRQRVDALAALIAVRLEERSADRELDERGRELISLCGRADELCHIYLRSSEEVGPGLLLDVADFIVYVGMELEGLPLLLELADSSSGAGDWLKYLNDGRLVALIKLPGGSVASANDPGSITLTH